jgi:hypothetical protein
MGFSPSLVFCMKQPIRSLVLHPAMPGKSGATLWQQEVHVAVQAALVLHTAVAALHQRSTGSADAWCTNEASFQMSFAAV